MFKRSLFAGAVALLGAFSAGTAAMTEIAPGVYFREGDVERGQANSGYIICDTFVVAVDAPDPKVAAEMYRDIRTHTDRPVRYLIITNAHRDHQGGVGFFTDEGSTVIAHEKLRREYADSGRPGSFLGVADKLALTAGGTAMEVFTNGTAHSPTDLLVYLPQSGVLFTGDVVVNMPNARLKESDIDNWIDTIGLVDKLGASWVCPGHGEAFEPRGGAVEAAQDCIGRLRNYLVSLRDEVAFQVVQGRSLEATVGNVRVQGSEKFADDDKAFADHVGAVYGQLTAPLPKPPPGLAPRALALIGDHYHPPAYIRPPLEAAFKKIGMQVEFLYDTRKLTASNLKGFSLLLVLRDGMNWPNNDRESVWWLTPEQTKAIDEFIAAGGGYLAMHNATALEGLGPAATAYRDILGSSYNGHGAADEKFTVRVVKRDHPVTRGVDDYRAIDERHRPEIHVDDAVILLESISGDNKAVNGYVRIHGKGRICHLANGHVQAILEHTEMQKLITNAALWCNGIER
ncbi:MAG: ThuA domain-containing protein [Planctomycetes bacterium]|nr:ThuA domain-containing protein [Planctomycetota bacterium]